MVLMRASGVPSMILTTAGSQPLALHVSVRHHLACVFLTFFPFAFFNLVALSHSPSSYSRFCTRLGLFFLLRCALRNRTYVAPSLQTCGCAPTWTLMLLCRSRPLYPASLPSPLTSPSSPMSMPLTWHPSCLPVSQ